MPEKLSFEEHLQSLEKLVQRLQEPLPLEESLTLYEQGVGHVKAAQAALTEVRSRVEQLWPDGTLAPYTLPEDEQA